MSDHRTTKKTGRKEERRKKKPKAPDLNSSKRYLKRLNLDDHRTPKGPTTASKETKE